MVMKIEIWMKITMETEVNMNMEMNPILNKDTDKGVGDLADTLLMITDIDGITQMVRDYKQHILNK